MQYSENYSMFAKRFADYDVDELVQSFNREIGCNGWSSMRAIHDSALIDEFKRRGIDYSVICNGEFISFTHPVMFDKAKNKLLLVVPIKKNL